MTAKLNIVTVYNRYLNRGGEDEVFEGEADLLEKGGCKVTKITDSVHSPRGMFDRLSMATNAIWSKKWYSRFLSILEAKQPDVVHVHNFFPNISPSIYYACHKKKIAVVQTLHNFRLLCPKATFYRNDVVCEKCLNKSLAWPAVVHACYRDSYSQSAVLSAMLVAHRGIHTWRDKIDVYIALTEFSKKKFIDGGLTAEKIVVKPNFVPIDPGLEHGNRDFALFVGRLSPEKGTKTLIDAFIKSTNVPVKIVGDGPLLDYFKRIAGSAGANNIEFLGRRQRDEVVNLMKNARFMVFPSEWYETFGLVAIEAYSCQLPVLASRMGAMQELIHDHHTGLHFTPGDAADLAAKVRWAWEHPEEMAAMGRNARQEYEAKYTAERNYELLMAIYRQAIERKRRGF